MTDISPVEETTASNTERTNFSSRFLALFGKGGESTKKQERVIPAWQEKAIEGVSRKDHWAISEVRSFFQKNGADHQRWYYAGANADIVPAIIAPAKTEHWWVDPSYDGSHRFHRESLSIELVQPFVKLGAEVQTASSWEEAWRNKRQVITVSSKTVIKLIGGLTQDESTVPETIDVIYTNSFSPLPGPEALMALKRGGFFLVANDNPEINQVKLHTSEKSLTDFGFQEAASIDVSKLSFPSIGKIRATSDGKAITFQIYRKTRDFTPEEIDLLQFDSCLYRVTKGEFYDFVLRYKPDEYSPEDKAILEESLRAAIKRYFSRINHSQSTNTVLLEETKAKAATYFETDEEIPEIIRKDSLFPHRNEDQIRQFCLRAKAIYQEVKKESNTET